MPRRNLELDYLHGTRNGRDDGEQTAAWRGADVVGVLSKHVDDDGRTHAGEPLRGAGRRFVSGRGVLRGRMWAVMMCQGCGQPATTAQPRESGTRVMYVPVSVV